MIWHLDFYLLSLYLHCENHPVHKFHRLQNTRRMETVFPQWNHGPHTAGLSDWPAFACEMSLRVVPGMQRRNSVGPQSKKLRSPSPLLGKKIRTGCIWNLLFFSRMFHAALDEKRLGYTSSIGNIEHESIAFWTI